MAAGLDVYGVMDMKITKNDIVQFLKFNIVGISNTLIDMGVFWLLTEPAIGIGLYDVIANIISYSCGIINSYVWNSSWTFRKERKRTKLEMLLFLTVNLVSLAVSTGVIYLCGELIGIESKIVCKLIAVAVSFTVNFIGNKLIVFKPSKDQ